MNKGSALDALMAELLGDVGKLHDQVAKLNSLVPSTAKSYEAMNRQLLADRARILESLKDINVVAPKPSSERAVMITVVICGTVLLASMAVGMLVGLNMSRKDKAIQSAWAYSTDITMLAACTGKGWRIENVRGETYCMPHPYTASDGNRYVAGWRIAKQAD
ncbi:MAG TPA: hypothetical protein DCK83_00945 [Gallionellaceae bacterium]|nr:hypothetical protein [Gallionellaceae bacterium]